MAHARRKFFEPQCESTKTVRVIFKHIDRLYRRDAPWPAAPPALCPFAYLKDVLSRLPGMTSQEDIDALKPKHWKAALPAE